MTTVTLPNLTLIQTRNPPCDFCFLQRIFKTKLYDAGYHSCTNRCIRLLWNCTKSALLFLSAAAAVFDACRKNSAFQPVIPLQRGVIRHFAEPFNARPQSALCRRAGFMQLCAPTRRLQRYLRGIAQFTLLCASVCCTDIGAFILARIRRVDDVRPYHAIYTELQRHRHKKGHGKPCPCSVYRTYFSRLLYCTNSAVVRFGMLHRYQRVYFGAHQTGG